MSIEVVYKIPKLATKYCAARTVLMKHDSRDAETRFPSQTQRTILMEPTTGRSTWESHHSIEVLTAQVSTICSVFFVSR